MSSQPKWNKYEVALLIEPESGKPPKQKVFSSLLTAPNEVYRQSKWEMMAVSR